MFLVWSEHWGVFRICIGRGWPHATHVYCDTRPHPPPLRERHPQAQLSFLSSWMFQCGERARGERHWSGLLGVKCGTSRNVPINSSTVLHSINCVVACWFVRCLPALNGSQFRRARTDWRQVRRLRKLGAVILVCLNRGPRSQQIERVWRKVEVIQDGWHKWVLVYKPVWE